MTLPQMIGNRFVIQNPEQDRLGRGGMGALYRATDCQTGETVAVKVLDPQILARDPELLERFRREGEALRQLNHPNIVRMIAAVEDAGRHYLVMEYVPGGSLRDLLEQHRQLPPSRVVELALDLADALTRAHRLGILHRDLKPANVLLAADGTPRLADFGIARFQDDLRLTQTGILMGTVDYLSPEACQGERLDERADIWALGVLLFEMLAGRLPFKGDSLTGKLTAILTQPVPDLAQWAPDAPDALVDLVYRMLEKDPRQRIASVRLAGAELEAVLRGRPSGATAQDRAAESRFAAPTPAGHGTRHNLPLQATPFVGRETELCELARLLGDGAVRLVTIVGMGGMGKSRLAVEAGLAALERFRDGVYFAALAPLASADDLLPTLAQVLGVPLRAGTDPRQQLCDYLSRRALLLILDNFEHLLAGAGLVGEILSAAPEVKVLATSRARLGSQTEQLFQLSGMDLPHNPEDSEDATASSAVRLFVQSARRVQPAFALSRGDLTHVACICRLVAGMPLGILLAAAWVEMLTPAEIAAEIQRSLDFLGTNLSGIPERQRSLRVVFDSSRALLSAGEREVFHALSVFRGGFTRDAAQAVTGASLRDLMRLVNMTFVNRTPGGRYGMHELLRQYAAEGLAQAPEQERQAQERHCAYYAHFVREREGLLAGRRQCAALAELDTEIDNVRAGWEWALTSGALERVGDYLEGLGELYRVRGWFQEGHELFTRAARQLQRIAQRDNANRSARHLLARALLRQGRFSSAQSTREQSDKCLHQSLALFRELGARHEAAYTLCYLGGSTSLYGSSDGGPYCEEAVAIFQEIGDGRGMALALRGLAWAAFHHAEYALARQQFEESLALLRQEDDQEALTTTLGGLGYVNWILGRHREARLLHEEALALSREMGDRGEIARAIGMLGIDLFGLQEWEACRQHFEASYELYRDIGDVWGMADKLGDLGEIEIMLGDYARAAEYVRESQSLYDRLSYGVSSWNQRILGTALLGLGDLTGARVALRIAGNAAITSGDTGHRLLAIGAIAELLMHVGKKEQALELLALVTHHRASWQMAKDLAAPLIARLRAELPAETVASAWAAGEARDLEATLAQLLVQLDE